MQIRLEEITQFQQPLLIAEIGVNHNGSLSLGKKMIDAAVIAGADAVKFQTFDVNELVTKNAEKALYQIQNTGTEGTQHQMLMNFAFSDNDFHLLHEYCSKKKVQFISSPFDLGSVSLLQRLGVDLIKIPSGEITNTPYLIAVAKTKKPIILSTGMSTLGEIEFALSTLKENGAAKICLLHCVSDYPSDVRAMNLRSISTLHRCFRVPVGLSDHTVDTISSIVAVSLGAPIIEKHFTLDKTMDGPDHRASMEPAEFAQLRVSIDNAFSALGTGVKSIGPNESNTRKVARKSLVTRVPIEKGQLISEDMLTMKRPGTGLSANDAKFVIGRMTKKSLEQDVLLKLEDLE